MRDEILKATKEAMKAKNEVELSTLRLMSAAIKEKDIEARGETGDEEGIGDDAIIGVLSTMLKQRRESAKSYKEGKRKDLAERELQEIEIISRFLPKQLSEDEIVNAIDEAINTSEASSIKDMGKVMSALKGKYNGQMDFAAVSAQVKKQLSSL